MRILVTNDDGIAAPGLAVAEAAAQAIAGPTGEVWTVAPAFEQSGVSHAISFTSPVKVEQLDERRFACAGTPADCVILAMHEFMAEARPDLVISGVNRGHNVAEDAVYSGTVGGAIEGSLQGVRSIALSQYFARAADGSLLLPDMFDAAKTHAADTIRWLIGLDWGHELFFNVNFPPRLGAEVLGRRFARQGKRQDGAFMSEKRVSPGGRPYFWIRHRLNNSSAGPEDDVTLCAEGWVTAVPMRADYTETAALERLSTAEG